MPMVISHTPPPPPLLFSQSKMKHYIQQRQWYANGHLTYAPPPTPSFDACALSQYQDLGDFHAYEVRLMRGTAEYLEGLTSSKTIEDEIDQLRLQLRQALSHCSQVYTVSVVVHVECSGGLCGAARGSTLALHA
jgi:hypothetical protein